MGLRHTAAAMGLAAMASGALAWQETPPRQIPPVQRSSSPNALVRHLAGSWTVDMDITSRLEPESRLAQFKSITVTEDPSVMKRLADQSPRLRGLDLILSGTLTIEGNASPYVVAQKDGMSTILWFQPAGEDKLGDSNARIVNLVVAKSAGNDLLFLGGEDGARNASVCFKRSESAR